MSTIQINEHLAVTLRATPHTPKTVEDCSHVESRFTVQYKNHTFPLSIFLNYCEGLEKVCRVHLTLAGNNPSSNFGVVNGHLEWIPNGIHQDLTENELLMLLKVGWENLPAIVHENFKMEEDGSFENIENVLGVDDGYRETTTFGCMVVKF